MPRVRSANPLNDALFKYLFASKGNEANLLRLLNDTLEPERSRNASDKADTEEILSDSIRERSSNSGDRFFGLSPNLKFTIYG